MDCNQKKFQRKRSFFNLLVVFFIVIGAMSMSEKVHAGTDVIARPGFGISRLGGHDYGTNGIGVWLSGEIRVGLSDTVTRDDFSGVGIIEDRLSAEDLTQARTIHTELCKAAINGPKNEVEAIEPATVYSVNCMEQGKLKTYQGKTFELSRELCTAIDRFYLEVRDKYARSGYRTVKLDVQVFSVERQEEGFLVAVSFINSGRLPIKMLTPDNWKRQWGDAFSVGGASLDGAKKWSVDLLGEPLVNKSEFPDETVEILAGSRTIFKILVAPGAMIDRGAYRMNALVFTGITGEGDVATMGKVDFRSNPTKATQINIDPAYPSTQREREQWEKAHRASMSFQPVKPGETFVEHGLYRAVRTSGGYRGLLLKPFKAGDVATTEPVTMPMDSELVDVSIDGPVQWVWEASAPTPIRQWSSDITDGTQQFCEPGATCPRAGRWVARVRTSPFLQPLQYEYQLAGILTLRRGDTMPPVQGQGDAEWEWVGAAHG